MMHRDRGASEQEMIHERSLMDEPGSDSLAELDERWKASERRWVSRLGRLRLGVEPVEEQLARHRRAAWLLALVPSGIALMVLSLFTAFGRPDIGLAVVLILFAPMIVSPLVGFARLQRRARAYLDDRAKYELDRRRLMESTLPTSVL